MILVRFQGKPFSITVIQICTLTTDAKEAEVDWFYDDLQHLLTNTHTHTHTHKCPFIIGYWNAKVGSQETPGVTGNSGLGVQNDQDKV